MKKHSTSLGALERRLAGLCLMLVVIAIGLFAKMPQRIAAMDEQRQNENDFYEFAELFSEIYQSIRTRYVEDVTSKQLFEGAINGMFATLDPHSGWLPPPDQKKIAQDTVGEYSGVGMHITLDKNKILTVISPIEGSPAARAGVAPWDRILEIDGESTKGIVLTDAVKQLTGPEGTSVHIKVWRDGEGSPLEFTLVRATIKLESVFSKILDDDIGYLRISKFQEGTARAVEEQLDAFNEAGVRGVVVDLRNNVGGLLDRAVEICDLFMPKKQLIVSIKGRNKANNRDFISLSKPTCTQPLVVLVNGGSASASEIFAGAMKDTGRGVILGPAGFNTFGKGSVQTISMIARSLDRDDNGDYRPSGLRLTTAKYYTPSGISIHEIGIEPDISIDLPKGHEVELSIHGYLGEPSRDEPGRNKPGGKDADPDPDDVNTEPDALDEEIEPIVPEEGVEGDEEGEGADPNEENGQSIERLKDQLNHRDKAEEKEEEKVFQDILLDEALKYLKAFLIFDNKQAA